MTTSDDVQNLIVAALNNSTVAEDRVYNPRTWPTKAPLLPILLVQSPRERMESKGKNAPAYDNYSTIRVVARITSKGSADDQAAGILLTALGAFVNQVKVAVINNYDLYLVISEIASVDVVNEVKAEGNQPYAEATIDFVCVFYQGAELFAPPDVTDLQTFALYGDMRSVFNPTSVYMPPFAYPVTEPPRHRGPEGRVEGGFVTSIQEIDRVDDAGDSRVSDRGVNRAADASLGG